MSGTLERAETLADMHRWDDAAAIAAAHLATDPGSVPALCLLARCRLGAGRHEEAADAARRAAALAPQDDWPLRLLAYSAASLGRHDEALAAAQGAVNLYPDQPANHLALANALVDAGRPREAIGPAGHVVRLVPNDPDAHNLLGISFARSGNAEGARMAYREALRLDPSHAMAANNLAVLDLDGNRLGRAARGITAGLRSDPRDDVLRHNLDLIGEKLVNRLLNAMLLTGFALMVVLVLEDEGTIPAWWPRALVGLALVGLYSAIAWATLRHLPPGMRRHLRSLPRRTRSPFRWLFVAVVSLALLVTAFAPGDIAAIGGVLFVVIIRGLQLFLVFLVLRWLWRKIAAAARR